MSAQPVPPLNALSFKMLESARSEKKKLVFLGGGLYTDAMRRIRFAGYNAITAGNHENADIRGDWDTREFWEHLKNSELSVVAVDMGSESWMSESAATSLTSLLKETRASLFFIPHFTQDKINQETGIYNIYERRYVVSLYEHHTCCFMFSFDFPQQYVEASEVAEYVRTCTNAAVERAASMSMSKEDFLNWRMHCLDVFPTAGRFRNWDDALEKQLELVSSSKF